MVIADLGWYFCISIASFPSCLGYDEGFIFHSGAVASVKHTVDAVCTAMNKIGVTVFMQRHTTVCWCFVLG